MTDPTPNTPEPNDDQVHNFAWWLCMLPFFAGIAFLIWRWWQVRSGNDLIYAVGLLIIGLVLTALVSGWGASADAENKGTTSDTTKSP